MRPQSYTKSYRQLSKSRTIALPKEEYSNWVITGKRTALKTYMQVTLYGLNMLYLEIYMYAQIYIYM